MSDRGQLLIEDKEMSVADYRYDEGLRVRKNGLSPAITTQTGRESLSGNTLLIKNATKQGYLEAQEGDGIDISSRMQYHRGTVQKQIIQTIDTQCCQGVVVDSEGISPTVKENHGTVTATIVNEINKNAKHQQDLVQSEDGSCRTIPAGTHASTPHLLKTIVNEQSQLRIRKLTPKECWRLMGFKDEEFEKAEKVNSNSQLYKQAGNSIVVNVLQKILENLLKGETNE